MKLILTTPKFENMFQLDLSEYPKQESRDRAQVKSGHLIPYWFKITDIREIRKYHLQNLLRLNTDPHIEEAPALKPFSPVRFDSPLPVLEHSTRQFFDSEERKPSGSKGGGKKRHNNLF